MIEYQIIRHQDSKELENEVNSLLLRGWQCQGGISVLHSIQGPSMLFQALIKNH